MKIFILLLILFNLLFATALEKELHIGTHHFTLVEESYNEYSDKGIELKFYAKEQDKGALPYLSLTLENQSGGCGEKSIQEGTYEIEGNMITVYTHWDRSGRAYDTPKGDRIQRYKVDDNGTISWLDGELYIERQAKNYDKNSDMQYLFHAPKTIEEKKALASYIKRVEHLFKGKFVDKDKKELLHKRVEEALMKKKQSRWQ